jgi:hypothetical protein
MMGVRKYRSIEDMPGAAGRRPLDPENLRLAFGLMDLARRLSSLSFTPGVYKFRSHGEMVLAHEHREVAQVRAARATRERAD